jgi:hypothetical protein
MPRQQRHVSLTTLLIVGEGSDDKAFIDHVKSLFYRRQSGRKITVKAGDGGSPGNIITHASRAYRSEDYNQRYLVLDADIPPTADDERNARAAGYQIILWRPQCLEGALLDVLNERVQAHEASQALKQRLHPRLAGHHTKAESYAVLFTQPVLAATQNTSVAAVRDLLQGH